MSRKTEQSAGESPSAESTDADKKPQSEPERTRVRINGRFLLILALTCCALGTGTHFLHSYQMERNANELAKMADAALEAGDTKNAAQFLAQYLRFRPEEYDSKVKLANILELDSQSLRTKVRVLAILEEVLRSAPDRDDIGKLRRRGVDLCIELRQFPKAQVHLKNLRKEDPSVSKAEFAYLDGICKQGTSAFEDAAVMYLTAIHHNDREVKYYVQLTRLLEKNPDAAPDGRRLDEEIPQLDKEVKSWFPRLRKKKSDENGAAAKKSETPRRTVSELIVKLYGRLVERGQPRHIALLSRAAYYVHRDQSGDLGLAEEDIAQIKNADSDVLYFSANLALTQAQRVFAELIPKGQLDSKKQERDGFLRTCEAIAKKGIALSGSNGLKFHALLARVDRIRAGAMAKESDRTTHEKNAEKHIDNGLDAVREHRKTIVADLDTKEAKRLTDIETELQTLRVEGLLSRVREANGDIDPVVFEKYQAELKVLAELGADQVSLGLFQARAQLLKGKWRDAVHTLNSSRRWLQGNRTWRRQLDLALSECYRQLNDITSQVQALQTGVKEDPSWHQGRLLLAGLLAERSRFKEATQHYQVLNARGIGRALLPFIRMQIRQAALVHPSQRNFKAVYANLKTAEKTNQDEVAVALLRLEATFLDHALPVQERYSRITKVLTAAIAKHPRNAELFAARARFIAQRTDIEEKPRIAQAMQFLDRTKDRVDDLYPIHVARADIAARLDKKAAQPVLAELRKTAAGLSDSRRRILLQTVAASYGKLGLTAEAEAISRSLADATENNLQDRLEVALRVVGTKSVTAELKKIRELEGPSGPWGNYVEAMDIFVRALESERDARKKLGKLPELEREKRLDDIEFKRNQQLEQARRLLAHASRSQPRRKEFWHQLGRIAALLGNTRDAYEHYQRAIDLGDRTSQAFVFAVMYKLSKREVEEADALIKLAARTASPLLAADRLNLSTRQVSLPKLALYLASKQGEVDRARSFIPQDSNDYHHKIALGLLKLHEYRVLPADQQKAKRGTKLLAEAHALHKKAVKLANEVPRAWIALVVFLERIDQEKEAEAVIADAMQKLPEDLRDITAARCFIILRKLDKAETHFKLAAAKHADNAGYQLALARFYASRNALDKALPYLAAVLKADSKATTMQRAVARHLTVIARASRGKYADAAAAIKQLDALDKSRIRDLYTRVSILQNSPLKQDRLALIDVLKQIDERRPLTPGNRFKLARLYELTDQWAEAEKIIKPLIDKYPSNSLYLSWRAVALMRNEGTSKETMKDAKDLLKRLDLIAPRTQRTLAVRLRILTTEKKQTAADAAVAEWMKRYIDDRRQISQLAAQPLQLVAKLCEELKLHKSAETLFKQYAARTKRPENGMTLAMYYGRQSRYADALNLCERLKSRCKPVAIAVTAANIVGLGKPSKPELQQAEKLVKAALAKDPESPRSQAVYAALLTSSGNLDEAEAVFRKILMKYPNSSAVANNLAWLLAMRGQKLNEALQLIDKVIERNGPLSELLDTRAVILLKSGRARKAIADLKQAIVEQQQAMYYLHLAQAQLATGDKPAAEASIKTALQKGLAVNGIHRLEQEDARRTLQQTGQEIGG